ncbi:MAG TPA: glycosyltransferase family 2 protein, partial [Candidatus Polarisedimenticolia bacterium]|nr:glycosyltransferase family 2 protein [Candidatus Polarisedimenticolia bacterium]
KAVKRGLRSAEVPVSYRRRIGRSKISGTISGSLRAGHKILWTLFRNLR